MNRRRLAPLVALALLVAPASSTSAPPAQGWGNLHGMSGLLLTPTAEVADDASVRIGYTFMDKKWSYHFRGEASNELYYLSFGFLPRVELTVRASVLPGTRLSRFDDAPIVDRMGSVRLQLLRGGRWPGLAVGIDDIRGTRFYHSLYAVGTQGVELSSGTLDVRASLGFGSRELEARNYLLDGFFGGVELRLVRPLSIAIDFDTEKWNSGARLLLFRRVSVYLAWLDLESKIRKNRFI